MSIFPLSRGPFYYVGKGFSIAYVECRVIVAEVFLAFI